VLRPSGRALYAHLDVGARRIAQRLDAARASALSEAAALTSQVLGRYSKACARYLGALEMELSFTSMLRRGLLGVFRRKSAVPAMLEELGEDFRRSLEAEAEALAREGAANLTGRLGLEIADISRELRLLAANAGCAGPADSRDAPAMARQREEVLRDVAFALAPVDLDGARAMIDGLKGVDILRGVRGQAASDVEALARLLVSVSELAAAHAGRIAEIDLNPVMVFPQGQGVCAVDTLVVMADPASASRSEESVQLAEAK